ncbi:DUF1349 domain-containing protein [Chitinophaga solisilvae]|uniref:DUF1349 domain-containing protein n=1 Tax=Chitinophaga solisilvae TaxID=1233460 RepID=A0A3S1D1A2_9BACT|nr:DUF1349 domain-containing protein [Chitinophaga solisilvae]NSL87411.1 DUF1349 domain-containing protein [Chitinophaga solisilvae]
MKKKLHLLNCLLILCCSAMAATPADSIQVKGIPHSFSWINTPKSFQVTDNALTITGAKGSDFFNYPGGNYNVATAPILAFTPDKDFILTVKVKVDFRKEYDGGAIYLMADSTQWLKFLFEFTGDKKMLVCSSVTNTYTDGSNNAFAPTNEVYLRLSKSGNMYGFFYSFDGKAWESARMVNFQPKGPCRLGFSSQSPLGESCTSTFSEISYIPRAYKSNKTGL